MWVPVSPRARGVASELADRHYPRQTKGSAQCLPPGRPLLLVLETNDAVWGAVENEEPVTRRRRWRCVLFRNESAVRSSDCIVLATNETRVHWMRTYGALPSVPLSTEVKPHMVRPKRDPGRCFRRAGWELWSRRRRAKTKHPILVFLAPGERWRLNLQGPVLR